MKKYKSLEDLKNDKFPKHMERRIELLTEELGVIYIPFDCVDEIETYVEHGRFTHVVQHIIRTKRGNIIFGEVEPESLRKFDGESN